MKQLIKFIACSIVVFYIAGCASMMRTEPLTLSQYRRNIIIRPDASIMIENDTIDFRDFHMALIKRSFVDKDRILLHVHEDVDDKVFEAVYNKLMELGYKNIEPRLYGE